MDNFETFKEIHERYDIIYERAHSAAEKSGRNINEIKIIAVSKTQHAKIIECAYKSGLRYFGENYVQEFTDKYEIINDHGFKDIEWHFIGHLQSNKVKYIANFVHCIHSVDSLKLASEIDKRALAANRKIDILLQLNTSGEYSKSGCEPQNLTEFAESVLNLNNVNILGLMTIGTFTDDELVQRKEFSLLRNSLNNLNRELSMDWKELSMGMTGDFETAIEEGATILRIGTAIFGERKYNH